ncbi:hypothetical protein MATR_15370 [Marivirga tractuosa]|uniref:Uncharacterized protein n=1 Tax=Marivirga tractuosa (strain ATCC 23168 / DSM 4126 / NBRC 15989 / NCIMB 1408 / VKM B-1430 / H-43) TaxID=643867 RepID=E4TSL7_MARTH|nr:hypothetical protein [Marivirga tractuosa]ADR20837.1 hypothetical protein Ftrac_0835 [Marivirga tractuosa DSM 4126]BDD14712.1 hypothetical protein MATR_15370 [Marivirga tractuosa]
MKTYPNILKPVKQYVLIGIIVLITLFGLTLKANAQSTLLTDNVEKINNAITVKLADYDYDIIIPKITTEELNSISDAVFNQLVYVADGKTGYYFYMGAEWELQKIREVFELIDSNLHLQRPSAESLIIMTDMADSKVLLDYNHHVKNIYQDFGFDEKDQALAVNLY